MVALRPILLAGAGLAVMAGASSAHAEVVVGPRFSYYFDNSNLRTSDIAGGQVETGGLVNTFDLENLEGLFDQGDVTYTAQQQGKGIVADQIVVPMVGAMINVGGDRDRFTLTAMYGEGNGGLTQTDAVFRSLAVQDRYAADYGSAVATARYKYKRYDVELTWQRRTSESFAFFAGARYERLERAGPGTLTIGITPNVDNLIDAELSQIYGDPPMPVTANPPTTTNFFETAKLQTFSARAGMTAFVPFSSNGVAFFNGMVHASYLPGYSSTTQYFDDQGQPSYQTGGSNRAEVSMGPDIAVGAQFTLAENIALDIRYRAVLFFPLSGQQSFSDARINHGVNVGVSFRL